MIAYFDSSALVKLFLAEPDGPVALEIWNEADHVTTSAVSYVEVRAALARAARENPHRLSSTGYEDAKGVFEELWSQIFPIAVSTDLVGDAGNVAEEYELRAYDALQFATGCAGQSLVIGVPWAAASRRGPCSPPNRWVYRFGARNTVPR